MAKEDSQWLVSSTSTSTSQRRKQRRYWTAFRHGAVFPCVHEAIFPPPGSETIAEYKKPGGVQSHHPPPGIENTLRLTQPASHIEIDYLDFVLKPTKFDICGGTTTQRFDDNINDNVSTGFSIVVSTTAFGLTTLPPIRLRPPLVVVGRPRGTAWLRPWFTHWCFY